MSTYEVKTEGVCREVKWTATVRVKGDTVDDLKVAIDKLWKEWDNAKVVVERTPFGVYVTATWEGDR